MNHAQDFSIGSLVEVIADDGGDIHDPPIGTRLHVVNSPGNHDYGNMIWVDWRFYQGSEPPEGYSMEFNGCWPMSPLSLRRIFPDLDPEIEMVIRSLLRLSFQGNVRSFSELTPQEQGIVKTPEVFRRICDYAGLRLPKPDDEDRYKNPYNRQCPRCGQPTVSRERRPNGNDRCKNGHEYPSVPK